MGSLQGESAGFGRDNVFVRTEKNVIKDNLTRNKSSRKAARNRLPRARGVTRFVFFFGEHKREDSHAGGKSMHLAFKRNPWGG